MSQDCVFCRIIAATLAAKILHEGERVVVLLDRNQSALGHLLVVPRAHVVHWHQLDEPTVSEMSTLAHRWARVLVRAIAPDGYNLLMNNGRAAGQDVFERLQAPAALRELPIIHRQSK